MKFTLESGKKGLRIRREILNASGFQHEEALDVHGMDHTIVILEEKMTAGELVRSIHSLKNLASDLLVHLAKVCGPCERCETPCPCTLAEDCIQPIFGNLRLQESLFRPLQPPERDCPAPPGQRGGPQMVPASLGSPGWKAQPPVRRGSLRSAAGSTDPPDSDGVPSPGPVRPGALRRGPVQAGL